jgi:murein L,D-transpeptidase YcbB/YkuD
MQRCARERLGRPLSTTMAVLAALSAGPSAAASSEIPVVLQVRIDQLRNGGPVEIAGQVLASSVVLPDFYERRGFEPAWTADADRARLLEALRASADDGLSPPDYHVPALESLARAASPDATADFDLLATDGLIRLAYHLRFGKVDVASIDPDWNFRPDLERAFSGPPAAALARLLEQHDLAAGLEALRPAHPIYAALRRALAAYREIESRGGWEALPAGPTLRPGSADPRLAALRRRLAVEGDLTTSAADPVSTYDSTLAAAVRRFQDRHGLTADGVLGERTRRALDVPVATRIAQLRLSLERGRLLLHDLPARFVLVNVPAFRVHYVDETGTHLVSDVIVGKPFTRTPIFRAEMTYVVLNPSWTVPPGILARDVLPGLRRDPDYLEKRGLVRMGGQIVQPPGPDNALGRIKLMFPNPHFVYLHDTPHKDLFSADARSFSSGCIRVRDIVDLTVEVLDDPATWSRDALLAALATGKTRNVTLARRIPVLVTYWTAVVSPGDPTVRFYDDVYDRDPGLLRALDGPFRFDPAVAARAAAVSGR